MRACFFKPTAVPAKPSNRIFRMEHNDELYTEVGSYLMDNMFVNAQKLGAVAGGIYQTTVGFAKKFLGKAGSITSFIKHAAEMAATRAAKRLPKVNIRNVTKLMGYMSTYASMCTAMIVLSQSTRNLKPVINLVRNALGRAAPIVGCAAANVVGGFNAAASRVQSTVSSRAAATTTAAAAATTDAAAAISMTQKKVKPPRPPPPKEPYRQSIPMSTRISGTTKTISGRPAFLAPATAAEIRATRSPSLQPLKYKIQCRYLIIDHGPVHRCRNRTNDPYGICSVHRKKFLPIA